MIALYERRGARDFGSLMKKYTSIADLGVDIRR
jgi:hypothetical protein